MSMVLNCLNIKTSMKQIVRKYTTIAILCGRFVLDILRNCDIENSVLCKFGSHTGVGVYEYSRIFFKTPQTFGTSRLPGVFFGNNSTF